jgi:putative Mg2+ transporter-C (MgtC) family protein
MSELTIIARVLLAALLGSIIGYEREHVGKEAGMRTHALVTMGSALFTTLSIAPFDSVSTAADPSRIASQVVIGIGFLAGGMLIQQKNRVRGLTTATELWVAAAIGMAVGVGWYAVALFTTFFVFLMLSAVEYFRNPNKTA